MKINNLVLLLLSFGMIYLLLFKKEKMSNTDIKKIVSQVYQADIESIRNLSKLANDLTNTGKLTVPGGLEILGEVTMKKGLKITGTIAGQGSNTLELVGGLSVKNGTVSINRSDNYQALDVNGISKFNKMVNMTNAELRIKNGKNGTTHFNYKNGGTNYIRGGVIVTGDVDASGNGYFGPAYIGKYKKIHNDWAQFCHKNQAGNTGKYALLQHKNGNDTYLNTGKNIWFRTKNNDKLTLINNDFTVKNGSLTVKGSLTTSNNKFKVYNNSRGSGEMGLYRKNGRQGIFFTSNYLFRGNKKAGIWTYHGNGGISKSLH
tara:strand:+ start:1399 stop:2349 length:951 start_codon:yes stop_codon:yes gene_type:complete